MFPAYKVFFEGGNPRQARLNRRGSFVNIVAVKTKAHFQTKGIPATQTTGDQTMRSPLLHQGLPQNLGLLRPNVQFKTTCPGITRGRNQNGTYAGDRSMGEMVIRQTGQICFAERLKDVQGLGALERQKGGGFRTIFDGHRTVLGQVLLEPFPIFVEIAGIDHQHVGFRGQVVHQQIIDQSTLAVGHAGILNPARKQSLHMIGRHSLQKGQSPGPTHYKLPHMRYIKKTACCTYGHVFSFDSAVTHRHLKAGEGDHLGLQRQMDSMERGLQ